MVALGLSGQGNQLSPSLKSAIPLRSFINAVSPSFIHVIEERKPNLFPMDVAFILDKYFKGKEGVSIDVFDAQTLNAVYPDS